MDESLESIQDRITNVRGKRLKEVLGACCGVCLLDIEDVYWPEDKRKLSVGNAAVVAQKDDVHSDQSLTSEVCSTSTASTADTTASDYSNSPEPISRATDVTATVSKSDTPLYFALVDSCLHCFHLSCIEAWCMRETSCPLCKGKVTVVVSHNRAGDRLGHQFVEQTTYASTLTDSEEEEDEERESSSSSSAEPEEDEEDEDEVTDADDKSSTTDTPNNTNAPTPITQADASSRSARLANRRLARYSALVAITRFRKYSQRTRVADWRPQRPRRRSQSPASRKSSPRSTSSDNVTATEIQHIGASLRAAWDLAHQCQLEGATANSSATNCNETTSVSGRRRPKSIDEIQRMVERNIAKLPYHQFARQAEGAAVVPILSLMRPNEAAGGDVDGVKDGHRTCRQLQSASSSSAAPSTIDEGDAVVESSYSTVEENICKTDNITDREVVEGEINSVPEDEQMLPAVRVTTLCVKSAHSDAKRIKIDEVGDVSFPLSGSASDMNNGTRSTTSVDARSIQDSNLRISSERRELRIRGRAMRRTSNFALKPSYEQDFLFNTEQ
eukprot:Lankesteria_metandrocarpae@DN2477_c0_g2_i1.p1